MTPKSSLAAAASALLLAPLPILAQTASAAPTLQPIAFSSSSSGQNPFAGEDIDGRSLASAPDGTIRKIAPQYGGGGGYHPYNSDNGRFSHIAFEVGGGFTAPIGNAASGGFTSIFADGTKYPTLTYGGNLLVGAGWNFSKRFALLGEFSYNANKIPGKTLTAFYNAEDAASGGAFSGNGIVNIGGNVHTFGYTAEPVFYYYNSDKHSYAGYVIGGVGFYHRSINFTAPVVSYGYFGGAYQTNQTFTSYTDNSLGANFGTGVSVKPFGQYSQAKLFAEVRYVFVNSPRESTSDLANGNVLHTGTEELIPVSIGIRF